ncbi:MAG: peptidoglycan-binding domain-containing protein [Christensenellales bacterium]
MSRARRRRRDWWWRLTRRAARRGLQQHEHEARLDRHGRQRASAESDDAGLHTRDVTGHYGNLTQQAVKKFQKAKGLTQDGVPAATLERDHQALKNAGVDVGPGTVARPCARTTRARPSPSCRRCSKS